MVTTTTTIIINDQWLWSACPFFFSSLLAWLNEIIFRRVFLSPHLHFISFHLMIFARNQIEKKKICSWNLSLTNKTKKRNERQFFFIVNRSNRSVGHIQLYFHFKRKFFWLPLSILLSQIKLSITKLT